MYKFLTAYVFIVKLIGMLSALVLQCKPCISSQSNTQLIEQRKYITAFPKQFNSLKTHKTLMDPGILSSTLSIYYTPPNDLLC